MTQCVAQEKRQPQSDEENPWGKLELCEAAAFLAALRPLLPPPPPGAPGPFALSANGALEALVEQAGLTPKSVGDVDCPFEYPDLETTLRGFLSAGPSVKAIQTSGEARVREAVTTAMAPFKLSSGTGARSVAGPWEEPLSPARTRPRNRVPMAASVGMQDTPQTSAERPPKVRGALRVF